jgi:hypothetical protein
MNKTLCIAAATGLLIAASARAQLAPSPKVGELKSFVGTWHCSGTAFAYFGQPPHPTKATIVVQPVLNDFWLDINFTEEATPQNPHPNSGKVHWGWDDGLQRYTGYSIDSSGGINSIESDGWQGNTIVWRGTERIAGQTFSTRDTFTRERINEFLHVGEAEIGGVWQKVDQESCRRSRTIF